MVIFGRIQRRLYAAGVIPDNMMGSLVRFGTLLNNSKVMGSYNCSLPA